MKSLDSSILDPDSFSEPGQNSGNAPRVLTRFSSSDLVSFLESREDEGQRSEVGAAADH